MVAYEPTKNNDVVNDFFMDFIFFFRYKRSKLERQINLEVIWCVVILVVLCFIGAVGSGMWLATFQHYVPFLNTLK